MPMKMGRVHVPATAITIAPALITATASSRNDSCSGVVLSHRGDITDGRRRRGPRSRRRAGVAHTLMSYTYRHGGGAEQAADDLGVEQARMFKSLVARAGDGLVFALVPATGELSLKKLAAAAGVKHAEMADPARRGAGDRLPGRRDQPAGLAPAGCPSTSTRAAASSTASA